MIELAVLGLLQDQPLHGYELKKRLSETLGFLWGVSYGSLYPALRRLERSGAIEIVAPLRTPIASPPTGSLTGDLAAARMRTVADRFAAGSRRTRKAYRITAPGEALLEELLTADDSHDDDKAFALKLTFCGHLRVDQRVGLLAQRRTALGERLVRAQQAAVERGPRRSTAQTVEAAERPDRLQNRYTRSLMEHRARATQRELEWIDELIAEEHAAPGPGPGRDAWEQEGASA